MTVAAVRRLALVAAAPATSGGDRLERVRALLRPEFLAEVWQADSQVFAPPREHPLLGLRKCAVVDCEAGVRTPNTDLCTLCVEKFEASGLPMERFTAIPANKISKGERLCRVPGCPRPSHLRVRFCHVHYTQWRDAGVPLRSSPPPRWPGLCHRSESAWWSPAAGPPASAAGCVPLTVAGGKPP
jgi:hypothetical protein